MIAFVTTGGMLAHLRRTSDAGAVTSARLASGTRITRAADDAAGLAMAENLDARVRSSRQAQRNVSSAVAILQTFESSFDALAEIYKRQKELAIQAMSDTLGDGDRAIADVEYQQLGSETLRIVTTGVLDVAKRYGFDQSEVMNVLVGPDSDLSKARLRFDLSEWGFSVPATDTIATTSDAQVEMSILDFCLNATNQARTVIGAWQRRLGSVAAQLDSSIESESAARSRILDADFAVESSSLAKAKILRDAQVAVLAQAGSVNRRVVDLLS